MQEENKKDIIKVLCDVKEYILMESYKNKPEYKWLNDSWTTHDILEQMEVNQLYDKKEVIEHLENIAHLFGKDRQAV